MEDFLSISALIPLIVSIFAVAVSSFKVKSRITAEKHFINAVRSQIVNGIIEVPAKTKIDSISQGGSEAPLSDTQLLSGYKVSDGRSAVTAVWKNGDNHSVYRMPPSSALEKEELRKKYKLIYSALLRSSLDGASEFSLVKDALHTLNESDRKKIESTLENNTSTGRRRYLATVFRDAMKITH